MLSKIGKIGQVVTTRGINNAILTNYYFHTEVVEALLEKYLQGDWGNLLPEDKELNDQAVKNENDRIFAKYSTSQGDIYIITEWDRSVTTILFPSEY